MCACETEKESQRNRVIERARDRSRRREPIKIDSKLSIENSH